MRRIGMIIGYDGTDYAGWQKQPGLITIQETMENYFQHQFGCRVHIMASGRTDAGVHARGQVAAMDFDHPIPLYNLQRAMNSGLPKDIRVYRLFEAAPDFQPRFDAKKKTYWYRFFMGPVMPPELARYADLVPEPLDFEPIDRALKMLEGEHDFLAFRASGGVNLTTVRTIYSASIEELSLSEPLPFGRLMALKITGNGFLYKMVRTIAGTLRKIGRGQIRPEAILEAYETGDRTLLGPCAEARGLMLMKVVYDKEVERTMISGDPSGIEPSVRQDSVKKSENGLDRSITNI